MIQAAGLVSLQSLTLKLQPMFSGRAALAAAAKTGFLAPAQYMLSETIPTKNAGKSYQQDS